MPLMIVESPNKIKKIESMLGAGWKVVASVGHVRDLPRKSMGVAAPDFALEYVYTPDVTVKGRTFPGGEKRIDRIRQAVSAADAVYIATDPDREGEAIAWHIKDALGLGDDEYERVTFDELSQSIIERAIANPRRIDNDLVQAQEARRALDRLVGYTVSPMLSDVLGMAVSAGRVQSPAVRLVVDLEQRIAQFEKTEHFGASVSFDGNAWTAQWNTKPFVDDESPYVLDRALAERAAACREFAVIDAKRGQAKKKPPSPFSTSLLLQAASTALNFNPEVTAKLAQRLFEQGVINYIRTDSVNYGDEAIAKMRAYAGEKGWDVPDKPRRFKAKAGAQEAHDAIRPIDITAESAGESDQEQALYRLIWQRAMASQLADAVYDVNTLTLQAEKAGERFEFIAKGRVLVEPGWRIVTERDSVGEEPEDEPAGEVPALDEGASASAESGQVLDKVTRPPSRFTQASLIAKLEAEGIGRPSTYSAIMQNILGKGYLVEKKRFLFPTQVGVELIGELMRGAFGFIELSFTRELEAQLDQIAAGEQDYVSVIRPAYDRLTADVEKVTASGTLKPRFPCPQCGGPLRRFVSKTRGPFWACRAEDCDTFMDDNDGRPVERKQYPCPKCETPLRRYKRKSKSGFVWVCPQEACETFLDDVKGKPVARAEHPCPKCGALLRRFQKKDKETSKAKGLGWFCTNDECTTFLDDDKGKPAPILTAPCPKCEGTLIRRKGQYGFWWGCDRYKQGCSVRMADDKGKPVAKKPGATKARR